ncbi:MAG: hypothetical protein ABSD58_05480 [Verrucomicrobiia bacterium]|jgi:hypothetical protein
MNPQREQFLNLRAIPARLTAEEAAWYLGFRAHEIPILVAKGLLKPLGRPPANGVKYFLTAALTELYRDVKWLSRASDVIVEHWRDKNARKTNADAAFPAISSKTPESVDTCGHRQRPSTRRDSLATHINSATTRCNSHTTR